MSDNPFSESVVQPLSGGRNNNNNKKRAKKAQIGGGDAFPTEQQPVVAQATTTTTSLSSNRSNAGTIINNNNVVVSLNDDNDDTSSMMMDDHVTVETNNSFSSKPATNKSNNNNNRNDDDDDNVATVFSDGNQNIKTNNNNNDDEDNVNNANVVILDPEQKSTASSSKQDNNSSSAVSTGGSSSNVPVIARSVGMPLIVSWVTAFSSKKGTALITGHYTIKTGIKLGDASAQDTVFEVKRSLMDLLQFRLAYMQLKPYIYIGDLPPEDTMKQDADEVLAFVHIIVNNPALCDSVLTWHLLTVPQEELKAIGLPSGFSVFKTVVFGTGSFFGPTEIPTPEQLKIEVISPQIVGNENLRNEVFRVLDLVSEACELARGFGYSKAKFSQRAQHWERLRVACIDLVNSHRALNEASSMFEASLRDVACDGALFWPWTMTQTLADEKLRIENDIKKQEKNKKNNNNNDNEDDDVYIKIPTTDSEKYRKTPHPSIQLGKAFLNAANLTENICKQTVALDLQNLITVVTLMTKVDIACAQSSVQAEEYFRTSSEELKTIHNLLKTTKDLASSSNFNEASFRQQLVDTGNATKIISERVLEMQADLRKQMQAVRAATHHHVLSEVERWVTGQRFTWTGAEMLAGEIKKRLYSELDGTPLQPQQISGNGGGVASSPLNSNNNNTPSSSTVPVVVGTTKNQKPSIRDEQFFTESLPMFEIEAGKQKKELSFGPPVLDDLSLAFNLGDTKPNSSNAPSSTSNGGFSVFGKKFFGNDDSSSSKPQQNQTRRLARHAIQIPNEDATMMMSTVMVSSTSSPTNGPRRERAAARSSAVQTALLDDPFARM